MKKRLCLLLLPLSILFSCAEDKAKPADLIAGEKMANILVDIHLQEAVIGRTIHHYDTSRAAYKQAHKQILKRHAISDSAFKHSYDYYLAHPDQMDKIYEVVLDSLSLREAKLTSQGSKGARTLTVDTAAVE
ncbi:DUF4296 domain-containing protein [Rufibacter immobilis]|uniref:DUF4296 domain-containing protein n=1 Tax=Rufibacter immobilis TaxID=1348778 RepID=UPI0011CE8C10|nr:DUF4296 domain-containing protein [Rufibacter immobilis]